MFKPSDLLLPFFAYGIFKPGELGFLAIKDCVKGIPEPCSVEGELKIRDGLPLLLSGHGMVSGALISFHSGVEEDAYRGISDLEPDNQYYWNTIETRFGKANYLAGKSPSKGCVPAEGDWNGKADPLFTSALEVIDDILKSYGMSSERETLPRNLHMDPKPVFYLEMAYLLLWCAIERYASLRYCMKKDPTKKMNKVSQEPSFKEALKRFVFGERKICRADKPQDVYILDKSDPKGSMDYYSQIRHNLVHRGKAAFDDYKRLNSSLVELLNIFRYVKDSAFQDSLTPRVKSE